MFVELYSSYGSSAGAGVAILASIIPGLFVSIIGIVMLVFHIKTVKAAVKFAEPADPATTEIVLAIFIPAVAYYLAEQKLTKSCQARGIPHEDRTTLYLILGFIIPLVDLILLGQELKKLGITKI